MRQAKYFISITPVTSAKPAHDGVLVHLQDYVADENLQEGQKQHMQMLLGNGTPASLRAIAKAIEKMADDIEAGRVGERYEIRDIEGA